MQDAQLAPRPTQGYPSSEPSPESVPYQNLPASLSALKVKAQVQNDWKEEYDALADVMSLQSEAWKLQSATLLSRHREASDRASEAVDEARTLRREREKWIEEREDLRAQITKWEERHCGFAAASSTFEERTQDAERRATRAEREAAEARIRAYAAEGERDNLRTEKKILERQIEEQVEDLRNAKEMVKAWKAWSGGRLRAMDPEELEQHPQTPELVGQVREFGQT